MLIRERNGIILTINSTRQFIVVLLSLSIILPFIGIFPSALAQIQEINLIDQKNIWKPFAAAILSQNNTELNVMVVSDYNGTLWNRAFLQTQINASTTKSPILNLEYGSKSYLGNATFFSEIRDNSSKILWNKFLNDTSGALTKSTFTLPNHILNQPIEFRLYLVTNGSGEHTLDVKRASLIIP